MEPFLLYTVLIGILASEHREAATRKSESGTKTFFLNFSCILNLVREKKEKPVKIRGRN